MDARLSVSLPEYKARVRKVREFVEEQDLCALIVFSGPKIHMWHQTGHVGYLSGWNNLDLVTDTMVLVPAKGEVVLMCPGLGYTAEMIRRASWIQDVRFVASPDPKAISTTYDDRAVASESGLIGKTFGQEIKRLLEERGLKGKVGLVGIENMPVPIYRDLAFHLGADNLREPDDIVARLRYVKSEAEIAIIRDVVKLSDAVFEIVPSVLKPRMSGCELSAELERFARANGADFANYTLASGPAEDVARGSLDIGPHHRVLEWGDQVMINTYLAKHGYFVQPVRSGTIGPASAQMDELTAACIDIQHEIIEAMKPGVPIADVCRVARSAMDKRGFEGEWGRFGHGQGQDYGEWPYFTDTNTTLLEPGVIAMIHPPITVPGSNNNFLYVPIGDVVLVTDKGTERLNRFPQAPFHVGI